MRRAVLVLILLLSAGLAVWAFRPQPVPVDLAKVMESTIEVTVEEEGEAEIREVYVISAPIAGKLQRINLHAGETVVAGQTIVASIGPAAPALLDARARAIAEASVAASQSAVDLAAAQVAQAEAALEFRVSEAARAHALFERSAISQHLLDISVLEQRTASAALDSAQANLEVRIRELESAKAVLENQGNDNSPCCVSLTAPISGQVLRVLTEDEQVVLPGTPILEIGNPGDLVIKVDLLSRDAVQVQEGAPAIITGWGGPDLPARVERIEPAAKTRVSALGIEEQRVDLILGLLGDPDAWKPLGHGFRVIARITLWTGNDVAAIPVGALFRSGSDWATYVVEDGKARLRTITLGGRGAEFVQVLDGVVATDTVILHPSDQIADGVSVKSRNNP